MRMAIFLLAIRNSLVFFYPCLLCRQIDMYLSLLNTKKIMSVSVTPSLCPSGLWMPPDLFKDMTQIVIWQSNHSGVVWTHKVRHKPSYNWAISYNISMKRKHLTFPSYMTISCLYPTITVFEIQSKQTRFFQTILWQVLKLNIVLIFV